MGLSQGNKSRTLANYDVAILPIDSQRIEGVAVCQLTTRSNRPPAVKRELEIVGFPFGFAFEGGDELYPVVITSHVASREIDSPFVHKIDRVVLATPSVANGTSGGPVFGRVKGKDPDDESSWELVGSFAGNLIDRSGAKLAKIVRIHALKEVLPAENANVSAPLGQ